MRSARSSLELLDHPAGSTAGSKLPPRCDDCLQRQLFAREYTVCRGNGCLPVEKRSILLLRR